MKFKLISQPFSWNDNMSEDALETFGEIKNMLGYGTRATLGTALAKLEILERQGAKVNEDKLLEEGRKRIVVKSKYGNLYFSVPSNISNEELRRKKDSVLEFLKCLCDENIDNTP